MYTEGVSYYMIDGNYNGVSREQFAEGFKIETLYVNDLIIRYDWNSGFSYAEDCVTHNMTEPHKLNTTIVELLENDAAVHKWMYRRRDSIKGW